MRSGAHSRRAEHGGRDDVGVGVRGEFFYHRSEHQYFTLQGALKAFCELTGESYDDCMDDYC